MTTYAVPFRLPASTRARKAAVFNARAEVQWFGLTGHFSDPADAVIHLHHTGAGAVGGGGTAALNGGLIAAGFDAAAVLAGLGHYDSDVVVTLDLSVRFLRLAHVDLASEFVARVVKSTRAIAFVEGELRNGARATDPPFATLTAMVGPI
ncbi:hotdog domain-containing protein [Nostoc sp. NIES-2111]